MKLVRWDPFAEMTQLREQVNNLFDQPLAWSGREPFATGMWAPAVDIEEKPDAIIVHAELPGLKPEDIHIEVEGDMLSVRGERKFEQKEEDQQYVRVERAYGVFQRNFTLTTPVKRDEVTACYHDGMLDITLPRGEEVKPKAIPITVEPAIEAGSSIPATRKKSRAA